MFDQPHGTIDHQLERESAACWRELGEIAARRARDNQRETVLLRGAEDRGDWKRAGFSSQAAWFAQVSRCEYRSALRTTEIAQALRALPAVDEALSAGALTLDQAAALTPIATPATDAELALLAVGKAPEEIARLARAICPPTAADDATLRKRRALSMKWIEGGRELEFKGRLPLEQGVVFEHAIRSLAKARRAVGKKTGEPALAWQQSMADALVALAAATGNSSGNDSRDGNGSGSVDDSGGNGNGSGGDAGIKRSNATVILHLSRDEPPFIEGAGTVSPETAAWIACDARRLTIKPHGRDLVHSRVERCASYAQLRALVKRSRHCQYPGCSSPYELQAHHLLEAANGGLTLTDDMILLCTRHHKHLHDHHIRTTGTGKQPVFTDEAGRLITTNRPHAPPR